MHNRAFLALAVILCVGRVSSARAEQDATYAMNRSDTVRIERPLPQDTQTGSSSTVAQSTTTTNEYGFKNVSDFYNIREANPQIGQGMWQVEFGSGWVTKSNGRDDDFNLPGAGVLYGVTDDMNVTFKLLPLNIGDGDWQGNGDLGLQLFNRFLRETEMLPALAGYAEMRIPSGNGSSGVDATFGGAITKTLFPNFRAHLDGFIKTVNGRRGYQTPEDYRHFQWGVGPGFDYMIDEKTTAILNYRMTSSEEYGRHNSNVLQLGMAREIMDSGSMVHNLRLATDIGLDGQDETPNFGMKLQYAIAIK